MDEWIDNSIVGESWSARLKPPQPQPQPRRSAQPSGAMKRAREAALGALAMATLSAGWAVVAWNTGFGGDIFIEPGRLIAELLPTGTASEPFEAKSAKSVEEAFAQLAMARAVEHGLQAWWCAVAFWLVVVPAFTFGGIFTVRRHGA